MQQLQSDPQPSNAKKQTPAERPAAPAPPGLTHLHFTCLCPWFHPSHSVERGRNSESERETTFFEIDILKSTVLPVAPGGDSITDMINGMPKSGKFTIKKSNDQGAPGSSKNLVRDHLAGPKRASPTEEMDFDDIPVTTAPSSASRPGVYRK